MPVTNTQFTFSLRLSESEYQRYYRGTARNIIVMTDQGIKVQFPASALQGFVSLDGVQGKFVITMDSNHKLVSLQQV